MPVQGFLKKIKEIKKEEIKTISKTVSFQTIRKEAETSKNNKDFKKALEKSISRKTPGIIAEIKKASPSKGNINLDIDPGIYAEKYEQAGACAVSVLTEQFYFKGSSRDLAKASSLVNIPVLRKDFIISSFQIYEAKTLGASSVLIINKLLERRQLEQYIDLARQLKMEPLVEIHSEWEIEPVMAAGAKIIGINNRNLETLETDREISKRIVPLLTKDNIPVEASGISSPLDIRKGMESKIYNFLVGESIVRAENPEVFIKELINA
ncbi:MAG: indole-3-glycerol phosphate synthase TrpC [Desulfobacula sp.]|nr:indole-3-glycerol phosphate synthase TrpC [Desulfobacula sp.]